MMIQIVVTASLSENNIEEKCLEKTQQYQKLTVETEKEGLDIRWRYYHGLFDAREVG